MMPAQQQIVPKGFSIYRKLEHVFADKRLYAYHHLIAVAWQELKLDSVLCINGLPTVYIHRSNQPISPGRAAELHRLFWNQGIATLLLLLDPSILHVYSSQAFPSDPEKTDIFENHPAWVESHLDITALTLWLEKLYVQLETGAYYRNHTDKFRREKTIDRELLKNLSATRDALTKCQYALTISQAHEFLGRILFTCYLIDRGIIKLKDYFEFEGKQLIDWLRSNTPEQALEGLYLKLFPDLRKRLNGSMFDGDLGAEQKRIKPEHIKLLTYFLAGDAIAAQQQTLGFWAYEFQMIPTETISGIYEDFLKAEDEKEKHKTGAYYTPRLLAEMTLDVLLEKETGNLLEKRFLDPSCGSGIFLVLLFNRLAAKWVSDNPGRARDFPSKAAALRAIFRNNLRGIDLNPTACHIACFSLYLAYLDQFDPRSIRQHCKTVGKFLPNLIVSNKSSQPKGPREHIPVIIEADFLTYETLENQKYDYIIGNPPWSKGNSKSLERRFMKIVPGHLKNSAHGGFLLPSRILLNNTTNSFQAEWLKHISIEKVVILADFNHVLFDQANCPCLIVRFCKDPMEDGEEWIEYITPKAYGIEMRNGCIPVSQGDQKWLSKKQLLRAVEQKKAPVFWKSHFWGTPRDRKFLSAYAEFPHLNDYAGTPAEVEKGEKRWGKGRGFEPSYTYQKGKPGETSQENIWDLNDLFIYPKSLESSLFIPKGRNKKTFGERLEELGALKNRLRRRPDDILFEPPLILFNNGYTHFAFIDYPVRFQHTLHVIAGKSSDTDALLFLTAYLKSKLAYYFIFHTSANIGTERTKAQLEEVLNIPFFLPDAEIASENSSDILKSIATAMRRLKTTLDKKWSELFTESSVEFTLEADSQKERVRQWKAFANEETNQVMERTINPLTYEYFGLIDQEITLVEDTYTILKESIHQNRNNLDNGRGIRQKLDETSVKEYAEILTKTLSGWMSPDCSIRINAICRINESFGLACVELIQSKTPEPTLFGELTEKEALAYLRLEDASIEERGSLRYLRAIRHFDNGHIRIYKPARLGFWMRSTAINDAAALHAEIIDYGGVPR